VKEEAQKQKQQSTPEWTSDKDLEQPPETLTVQQCFKKTLLEKLSKQKTTTINLLSTGGQLKTEIMKNTTTTSTKTTKMPMWGNKNAGWEETELWHQQQ